MSLDCGPDQAGVTYDWDWDGDTVVDDSGCLLSPTLPAGAYAGVVTARTAAGCVESAPVSFTVDPQPSVPLPTAVTGCEIDPVSLDCGPAEPGVIYEWDWDGDTVVDDTGCAVSPTLPAAAYSGVITATTPEGLRRVCSRGRSRLDPQPLVPVPSAVAGCEIDPIGLDCGVVDPGVTHEWGLGWRHAHRRYGLRRFSDLARGLLLRERDGDQRSGLRGIRSGVPSRWMRSRPCPCRWLRPVARWIP